MTNPDDAEGNDPKCFECGTPCDDDNLCHGCKSHICDDCDINLNIPLGGHESGLHLEESDDEPE